MGGQISKQKARIFKVRGETNPPFQTQRYFELSKLISKVFEARPVNYCSCIVLGVTASGKLFKCHHPFTWCHTSIWIQHTDAVHMNVMEVVCSSRTSMSGLEPNLLYPSHGAPVKKFINSLAGKRILAFFQTPLFIP